MGERTITGGLVRSAREYASKPLADQGAREFVLKLADEIDRLEAEIVRQQELWREQSLVIQGLRDDFKRHLREGTADVRAQRDALAAELAAERQRR